MTIPTFPTPEGQNLGNWVEAYKEQAPHVVDLLIGHSLGATFILKLIEHNIIAPKHAILISTVGGPIGITEYDALNDSFIQNKINYKVLQESATTFTIIHGSDDPYVPLHQAQEVPKKLNIDLHLIEKGGHLNTESGYTQLPEILDYIHV